MIFVLMFLLTPTKALPTLEDWNQGDSLRALDLNLGSDSPMRFSFGWANYPEDYPRPEILQATILEPRLPNSVQVATETELESIPSGVSYSAVFTNRSAESYSPGSDKESCVLEHQHTNTDVRPKRIYLKEGFYRLVAWTSPDKPPAVAMVSPNRRPFELVLENELPQNGESFQIRLYCGTINQSHMLTKTPITLDKIVKTFPVNLLRAIENLHRVRPILIDRRVIN